jgi:hypothetical protein
MSKVMRPARKRAGSLSRRPLARPHAGRAGGLRGESPRLSPQYLSNKESVAAQPSPPSPLSQNGRGGAERTLVRNLPSPLVGEGQGVRGKGRHLTAYLKSIGFSPTAMRCWDFAHALIARALRFALPGHIILLVIAKVGICAVTDPHLALWSGREDSNLRPPRPERGALPG